MENTIHEKKKPQSLIAVISAISFLAGALVPLSGILFLTFINQSTWSVVIVTILIIIANILTIRIISIQFSNNIKKFKTFNDPLSKGNLPGYFEPPSFEMAEIANLLNNISSEMGNIKNFFVNVGQGNFDSNIKIFKDEGELGQTLSMVREELKKGAESDRQRNWANEGFGRMTEILRREDGLDHLCNEVLSELVKYISANQGNIFIINDKNFSVPMLELKSAYAYGKKRFVNKTISPGEGLVGQAWLEKDTIYLREVPQNYTTIRSGLGEATPNNVLIVPLKNEGKIEGIIEIASFKYFNNYEIRFVEKVAESISLSVTSLKVSENTRKLLEETQQMTKQMREQEEEMRQNMEELEATQEEMLKNSHEIIIKESNLNSLINNIDAAVISMDTNYKVLTANNEMIEIYKKRGINFKIGDNTLEKLPEDEREHRKSLYQRAFNGEKFSLVEEVAINTNTKSFLEIIHIPIYSKDDKVTGATIFAKDITRDTLLRNEVSQKKALLEGLINNTDDNIMALDRDYNVTIINDRYKERDIRQWDMNMG